MQNEKRKDAKDKQHEGKSKSYRVSFSCDIEEDVELQNHLSALRDFSKSLLGQNLSAPQIIKKAVGKITQKDNEPSPQQATGYPSHATTINLKHRYLL